MTTPPEAKNAPTSAQAKPTTEHASSQPGEAAAIEASGMGPAVMKDSQAALKEITAGSQEWMGCAQKAYQTNLKAWQGMVGWRTPTGDGGRAKSLVSRPR